MTHNTSNNYRIGGKNITVYECSDSNKPIIYLHIFNEEDTSASDILNILNRNDFTLVVISGLDWGHDMSPWEIPAIRKGDTPCSGGANDYLPILVEQIIPAVESQLTNPISWRGLAGYSLAGLFAIYALYHTTILTRIASVSGSLWFPDFKEFVLSKELKIVPDAIYLSIGDKESNTKNTYLKWGLKNTEEIALFYKDMGLHTIFELNAGNHFHNIAKRTARGLSSILK